MWDGRTESLAMGLSSGSISTFAGPSDEPTLNQGHWKCFEKTYLGRTQES